jgi:hypothetical protein
VGWLQHHKGRVMCAQQNKQGSQGHPCSINKGHKDVRAAYLTKGAKAKGDKRRRSSYSLKH